MKKILFCDMDGTIINESGLLYSKDKEMIKRFRDAGNIFVFNTGRNIEEVRGEINKHDLAYDYLILNNGAQIMNKDETILYRQAISKQVGVRIIEECLKYNNLWVYFFDGKKTLAYYRNQTYRYSAQGMIAVKEYDFLKEYSKTKEFDIIAIHQDDQQLDNVLKIKNFIAENYNSDAQGTLNQHYLDITPSNCTKGTGITNLVNLINGDLISYAIGDSYNDISMFEHADYGYTFNRVSDEVKKYSYRQVENLSELIAEII